MGVGWAGVACSAVGKVGLGGVRLGGAGVGLGPFFADFFPEATYSAPGYGSCTIFSLTFLKFYLHVFPCPLPCLPLVAKGTCLCLKMKLDAQQVPSRVAQL